MLALKIVIESDLRANDRFFLSLKNATSGNCSPFHANRCVFSASGVLVPILYIKVHTATRWTIRHSLMLHWFADLMNVKKLKLKLKLKLSHSLV